MELGTQLLGDFLDFGIITKLCLGDAFGAVTLLQKPETWDMSLHFCLLFIIKLVLWSGSFQSQQNYLCQARWGDFLE